MLASALNVYNTCLVILKNDGFTIQYDKESDYWSAEKLGFKFAGESPIELLGLSKIYDKLQPKTDYDYWWEIAEPNLFEELAPEVFE